MGNHYTPADNSNRWVPAPVAPCRVFSIHLGSDRSQIIGSPGEYAWGGAASTLFWIDPVEDLIVIFMTQFIPDGTFNFRGQLKALIYPAIMD